MDSNLLDRESTFIDPKGGNLWDLDRRLTKALKKIGIIRPTIIQSQVIPLALEGKDLLVRSRTGSGKTLAYLLPLIQKILSTNDATEKRTTSAIILVPTRELCDQVESSLQQLLQYCSDVVTCASLGSGTVEARRARLKEVPDILISTPGRLAEHVREDESLYKNEIETFVVDECDLVLSYGCEGDVRTICSRISRSCQGILLSATLDDDINALKKIVLNEPAVVKLRDEDAEANHALKQWYLRVVKDDKDLLLYSLLKLNLIAPGKALFFVNSVDRGYRLKLFLEQFGVKSAVLNAELPENSRKHILDSFEKGMFDNLIATDEAVGHGVDGEVEDEFGVARGVDFKGVQTVINVDMPATAEEYIHRVGRTARAGAAGTALSIVVAGDEDEILEEVQESQPKRAEDGESQPSLLALNVAELEGFRYRVEGMSKAVTKKAIKTARVKDLRNEILNSEKLQAHFQDNPRDLQLLKHDAPLKSVQVQRHLAHVPGYLLPSALVDQSRVAMGVAGGDNEEEANFYGTKNKKKRGKMGKTGKKGKKGGKKRKVDPLL